MNGISFRIMVTVMVMVLVSEVKGDDLSPSQCKNERRLGEDACKPVIFGQPPSATCCERIRVSHFECVCPVFTPKLAALIPINKAIAILKTCGRRIPPISSVAV